MTASRSPKSTMRPFCMTATCVIGPSVAGRWVIMMTIPPRWRTE
jgi:hypothetical protein